MINLVKKYASSGLLSNPFPDRYNSVTGLMKTDYDRTIVGGHFALVRRSGMSPRDLWRLIVFLFSN
jgi:hypothetical protein